MSLRSRKPAAHAAAAHDSQPAADAPAADRPDSELDYEAQRQRQIQRNQALLTQLTGVEGLSTSLSREQVAAAAEARAAAALIAKQARAQARAERAERMALVPRRDLPPRRARGEVNYTESAAHGSTAAAAFAAPTLSSTADDADAPPRENASLSDFVVADSYPIARSSSGTSSKLVRTLPLSHLSSYLGLSIPLLYHSPKAAAMSFLVSGWPSESNARSHKAPPAFNKMSGIHQMANGVVLFINVDLPAEGAGASMLAASASSSKTGKFASYSNQWSDSGRCVTWFAQPTQRVGTPVIGKIIAAAHAKFQAMRSGGRASKEDEEYAAAVLGDAAAAATPAAPALHDKKNGIKRRKARRGNDDDDAEITIKSEPMGAPPAAAAAATAASSAAAAAAAADVDDGSFDPPFLILFLRFVGGPYVYAGQLAYRSHDTTRTPMRFDFELADFDRLIQQADFRKLLPDGGRAAIKKRQEEEEEAAAATNGADTAKPNKKARK